MVGLNPEFAHETMSGLSFSQAVAQTLWHGKLFHIDLNAQRIGKFDQDFRFGSEGIRDAFYVVKLLEDAQWDGMRHFDAHPYRTEDADGVWDFARGCMRTYLILADKARRFHEDTEIQDALRVAKVAELGEPTRRRGGLGGILSSDVRRGRAGRAGLRPRAPGPTRHGTAPRGPLVPLVVGVDSSTSACKVQVRDAETGAVVASGRAPHPPTTPPRSEQHPRDWEAAFDAACAEAGVPDDPPARGARRRRPAARSRRPGRPAMRSCGRPSSGTTPSRRRTPRTLLAALAGGPAAWAAACGSVPVPSFTITKLRWLRRCEPEVLRRTAVGAAAARLADVPAHRPTRPPTGATPRGPATGHPRRRATATTCCELVDGDVDWEAALPEVLPPDAVAGEWAATGAPVAPGHGRQHGGGTRPRAPAGRPRAEPRDERDRVHRRATSPAPTRPARWPASPTRPVATCRWSAP